MSRFKVGLAIGAITGAVVGIFSSNKPGKKLRTQTKHEFKKYRKMLHDDELEAVVIDIFGHASKSGKYLVKEAKDQLALIAAKAHETVKTIRRADYGHEIDNIVDKIGTKENLSEEATAKLHHYLVEDAKKFQTEAPKTSKTKKKKSKTS